MALRLVPDWPLSAYDLLADRPGRRASGRVPTGFRYGQASLLACATGNPVAAFGPLYATLRRRRAACRGCPAPPYHFISRISSLSRPAGRHAGGRRGRDRVRHSGGRLVLRRASPTGQMPFVRADRSRAAAVRLAGARTSGAPCTRPTRCSSATSMARACCIARFAPMTAACACAAALKSTLARGRHDAGGLRRRLHGRRRGDLRAGDDVRVLPEGRARRTRPGWPPSRPSVSSPTPAPRPTCSTSSVRADASGCPKPAVRMCERVTHREVARRWAGGAPRREARRPSEWFFKAHFFQDPVQPGSLGIEALVQLLQAHLLLEGAAEAVPGGVFADMVTPDPTAWQFRGQVMPEASLVSLTLDAEPIEKSDGRWSVRAQGSVWVDGRRIYQLRGLTVSMEAAATPVGGGTVRLDPAVEPWWNDHRPTYAAPVLPGMAVLSLAMQAAADVVGVDDLVLRRWLILDQPATLTIDANVDAISITENGKPLAEGRLVRDAVKPHAPEPLPPLHESAPALRRSVRHRRDVPRPRLSARDRRPPGSQRLRHLGSDRRRRRSRAAAAHRARRRPARRAARFDGALVSRSGRRPDRLSRPRRAVPAVCRSASPRRVRSARAAGRIPRQLASLSAAAPAPAARGAAVGGARAGRSLPARERPGTAAGREPPRVPARWPVRRRRTPRPRSGRYQHADAGRARERRLAAWHDLDGVRAVRSRTAAAVASCGSARARRGPCPVASTRDRGRRQWTRAGGGAAAARLSPDHRR